jgi:hypothetical protein
MNARRSSTKATIRFETLEDRITPVAIDPSFGHLTAMRGAFVLKLHHPGHPGTAGTTTTGQSPSHLQHQAMKLLNSQANNLHHNLPKLLGRVGNPVSLNNATPLSGQPIARSGFVPVAPQSDPVTVSPSPTVPPATGPVDPNHGGPTPTINPPAGSTGTPTASTPPATANPGASSSLPANVSQDLQTIYQEFKAAGQSSFTSTYGNLIPIEGFSVGVMVHGNGGDFSTLLADMQALGLQVKATDATSQTIEGMMPLDALAKAANDSLTLSITPDYTPVASAR